MSTQILKPTKRKRVPDALRRRAAVSCDRCKLRRAKCIRASVDEPCSNCVSSRTECQSTLPRKQRVYGSLESLSLRYRALDALVKGLLQDEESHDLETLYRVAAGKGISMPALEDQTPTQDIFAHPEDPKYNSTRLAVRSDSTASSTSNAINENNRNGSNPFVIRPVQKHVEERLIPTPHGVSHYVGPSSSFEFAATARKLVARCGACSQCRQPRKQQRAVRAEFVGLKNSKALEPRTADRETDAADGATSEPDGAVQRRESLQPSTPGTSQFSGTTNERISDFLPPRSTADALMNAFFDRVHINYPIFHRSIFQLRYEAVWDRKSDFLRDLDPGWVACLAMIFVFGAQALERYDLHQATLIRSRYTNLVHHMLGRILTTTSLLNVQALLLLQLYEHNAGERNASWMLLGAASRMAVALGMHREGTNTGFDPIERNIRKRVWWTAYLFEKLLAVILGRPSNIDDREVSVTLPEESMFDSGDTPPEYTTHYLSLIKLMEKVKLIMYPLPTPDNEAESDFQLVTSAKELLEELESWYNNLPKHLLPDNYGLTAKHSRAVLLLHLGHLYTKALITRPILVHRVTLELESLERNEPSLAHMPQDIITLGRACVESAEASVNYLKLLFDAGLLDGVSWIDAYYIYHSKFVLCTDLLVRPADSVPSRDELHTKAVLELALEMSQATRMAPTFRILSQIAVQYSAIIGAVPIDETSGTKTPNEIPPSQSQQLQARQMQMVQYQDPHIQDLQQILPGGWFDATFAGLPWDCFDMGAYGNVAFGQEEAVLGTAPLPAPLSVTLGSGPLGPGPFRSDGDGLSSMRQVDDWAARALREMGRGYN